MAADFNVTDPVFEWAERTPEATAVAEGEQTIRYDALCASVERAANDFRRAGLKPGDRIGIALPSENAMHLVVGLALARMGATQVSLHPGEPVARRRSRVGSLGIRAVVGSTAGLGEVLEVAAEPGWLAGRMPAKAGARTAGGERHWIIAQSSGTTAEPKNIAISHRDEQARGERLKPMFAMLPGERYLNLTTLRFQVGMAWALRCLSDGAVFVVPPAGGTVQQLLKLIDTVGFLACTPRHLQQFLEALPAPGSSTNTARRLPALRVLRCSTATLPAAVLQEVRRRISPQVYVNYGTNETGPLVAAGPELLKEYPDCVGRPVAGVEVQIADEAGQALPPGQHGRIGVRGEAISASCLLAPAASDAAAFRDGWFYPGDAGMRNEEGIVFFRGRSDERINFDGQMIAPEEIEAVLAAHPGVTEVAVFAVPLAGYEEVPMAALVLKDGHSIAEIRRYCGERLGVRAPKKIFRIKALPRNPMGKIMRKRLAKLASRQLGFSPGRSSPRPPGSRSR